MLQKNFYGTSLVTVIWIYLLKECNFRTKLLYNMILLLGQIITLITVLRLKCHKQAEFFSIKADNMLVFTASEFRQFYSLEFKIYYITYFKV